MLRTCRTVLSVNWKSRRLQEENGVGKYLDNRRYVYQKEGGKRSCKKEPRTVPRENVVQKCADVLKTVKVIQFKVQKITVFSPEREEIIKLAPLGSK
jgi:hypothetical protein